MSRVSKAKAKGVRAKSKLKRAKAHAKKFPNRRLINIPHKKSKLQNTPRNPIKIA